MLAPKRIGLLLLAFLLLFLSVANAEHRWSFRSFSNLNDVPFQEVRDILEDDESGIWIATWGGGVTRVHGTHWTTYDESNGLPSNWVRSLDMDASGRIWIGTTRGLCRICRGRLEVFSMENVAAFPNNGIRDVKCLQDTSVWVSFDEATVVLAYHENATKDKPNWSLVADDWECGLIEQTSDGRIWIANGEAAGLRSFDGNHWRDVELGQNKSQVEDFFESRQGELYVVVDSSLRQVTADYETTLIRRFDVASYCVDESSTGRVYVGHIWKTLGTRRK